jgi:hypothetical protein
VRLELLLAFGLLGCAPRHVAQVGVPELPPLPGPAVRHSGKLWIELRGYTEGRQCARPEGQRTLCFDRVDEAMARAILQTTWTSFPGVALKRRGDELGPGDYLLLVTAAVLPVASHLEGPGWSSEAHAGGQLARDGLPVASGEASSRSRAGFGYGRALGVAAGEAIGAIAAHIASRLVELPEARPQPAVPLPPVMAAR